jgi:predicted nucleotidyltransferase component of viral defense system
MQEKYYQEFLYPLQNKILKIIGNLEVEFYLTGGTALGRCYLFHRYSDDLDFFVNNSGNYKKNVETVINSLKKEVNLSIGIRAESFCRIIVSYNNTELKLDFVNDIETHFGDFHATEIFHKVDNPLNILSNKISALPRLEEKDIADI